MHPSTLLILIVLAAGGTAAVHGHPAASTPAARFWEQALPGTPMPEAIADLVQKGIDHSPFVEHYPALPGLSVCGAWSNVCTRSMAAGTGIFFHKAQLRPGSTMAISFPAEPETAILPDDDVAEKKAPFGNLTDVLATFAIPPGSAEAEHARDTLKWCQAPPQLAGELMACATSLETTVRSATRMLGGATGGVWAAASSALPHGAGLLLPRQRYVVEAVAPLDGDHFVACHRVPFPYAVFQCHMTTRMTDRAYVVKLRGLRDGLAADMVAFCHLDTSNWNPAHPAFEILHTQLGTPVCHFIPYGNPVFGNKKKAIKP